MNRSYILSLYLDRKREIEIGRLGKFLFKRGNYLYVGSAKRNIEKRIERHLKTRKKIFWHIDYLLQYAKVREIWVSEKEESNIARILESLLEIPVAGFGSSDKRHDKSHLFYGDLSKNLLQETGFVRFITSPLR
jgi:Uri superfamily endonuclease